MSPKGAALLVLAFLEDERPRKVCFPKGTSFCARGKGPSNPALGARVEPGGLALVPRGQQLPGTLEELYPPSHSLLNINPPCSLALIVLTSLPGSAPWMGSHCQQGRLIERPLLCGCWKRMSSRPSLSGAAGVQSSLPRGCWYVYMRGEEAG